MPVADTSPHSLQAFANGDFISQWANGHANFADADLITPPAVVNFAMHHLGVFKGRLLDPRGNPFPYGTAQIDGPPNAGSQQGLIDPAGNWSMNVTEEGDYTVSFGVPDGVTQWAYGQPAAETATHFHAGPDQTVTVNDTFLDKYRLPHVRGTVIDGRTGLPIRGAGLEFYNPKYVLSGQFVATASSDENGHFDAILQPGRYKVVFGDQYGVYATTWLGGTGSPVTAKVLKVAQGQDQQLSVRLGRAATLTGIVLNKAGHPLFGACPEVHFGRDVNAAFWFAPPTCSDGAGTYTVHGLFPGQYTVLLNYTPDPYTARWLYGQLKQARAALLILNAQRITAARPVRLPTALG
jgi:Carboxypeptidase regulatory-like domain